MWSNFLTTLLSVGSQLILSSAILLMMPFDGSIPFLVISAFLIPFFSYMYHKIVFQEKYIKKLFTLFEADDCAAYMKMIKRTSIVSGVYLSALFIIAYLIADVSALFIEPTIFLLLLGAWISIKQRFKAIIIIKSVGYKLCHTVFDGLEAEIKKAFLSQHNIECQIEPLTFVWELPIRTALSEFRLYVDPKNLAKACEILDSRAL